MSQIKLANFLKLDMFFVFGVSAFLQVTENPKDFKPAKSKNPRPLPSQSLADVSRSWRFWGGE